MLRRFWIADNYIQQTPSYVIVFCLTCQGVNKAMAKNRAQKYCITMVLQAFARFFDAKKTEVYLYR